MYHHFYYSQRNLIQHSSKGYQSKDVIFANVSTDLTTSPSLQTFLNDDMILKIMLHNLQTVVD